MVFWRNSRLFFAIFFLVVAGVAAWVLLQKPIYSAEASLLIDPLTPEIVNVKSVTPDLPANVDVVDTQVRLLQSPTIARRAADTYAARHAADPRSAAAGREQLVRVLQRMVKVKRAGVTFVIDITARSDDPLFAADIANSYAHAYIDAQREAKLAANQQANGWLDKRTAELRDASAAADAALQRYKIANGLLSANGATNAEQEVSTLNQQIAAAKADLAEKSGRLNAARAQLRSGGGGADVGAALGSDTIRSLRQSEATVSAQVAELEAHLGELHPDLVKAKSQLRDVRAKIQQEIDRILSSLEAEVQVSSSRLASLQGSQSRANAALAGNNAAAVDMMQLQQRADAARAVYEAFLARLRETGATQGLQQADARIAAMAEPPREPDFPNKMLAALAGIAGGLVLGLVGIAVAEYLQGGLRTKADVERKLRIRYAGAVPTLQSTLGRLRATEPPVDYIVSHPLSVFAESFRAIQAFLLLGGGRSPGPRVVAITSALPQEGKTTTATCLARSSALGGARTVIVDCDLRRRGTSALLLRGAGPGLHEYMRGEASLDAALVRDDASGAWVLGTSTPQQDARDPLTPANLARLLADLRARFDVIILDTAPVLGVADARAVAASADRVLILSRWRHTSVRAVEAAVDVLLDAGAKISGAALTQVDITRYASTGHGDAYGYQKKFRGYYTN